MASLRKRGKVYYFRFTDASGTKRERRGCSDKRATEAMAATAEAEVAKIRAGLFDAKALALIGHASRSLAEHLDAWQADLEAKGGTAKHSRLATDRARRLVAVMRGGRLADLDGVKMTRAQREDARRRLANLIAPARLADLTTSKVQAALGAIRSEGRSLQTCNHHRAAIKAFSRWAVKDGRLSADPLMGLARFNAQEDRRHDRRTLSLDELRHLIDVAHAGAPYRLMTGPARALCYRLAVASGLRYSELRSLTRESFRLDAGGPTVTVQAAYAKNGQTATLPLPADVARDLIPYLSETAEGVRQPV